MEDKELEQKIITVMKFAKVNLVVADELKEPYLLVEYPVHKDWRFIHSAWEQFKEEETRVSIGDLSYYPNRNTYINKCDAIKIAITDGTPLEAFTALHDGIKWFNSLNKEG